MSRQEWEELPDAPDLVKISRKKRNQEYQRYTPVPDSILAESAAGTTYDMSMMKEPEDDLEAQL